MKRAKDKTKNYTIEHATNRDRFAIMPTYHLLDKRLTLAEKGFLSRLYILPNDWKITQRATAEYFDINKETFNKYVKKLIEIGYIEIQKTNWNKTTYLIKEKATKGEFDVRNINNYTIKQLNEFLNDQRTEQRYKNLIKKALESATQTDQDFKKMLEELEEETKKKEQTEDYKLPF